MLVKVRHVLLPLALALPLTGCGQEQVESGQEQGRNDQEQVELRHSEQLEALLPPASDYPAGFDVETIDITELDDSENMGMSDFDSVEPAVCEKPLSGGIGDVPESAFEGVAQALTPTEEHLEGAYLYVLSTGDFVENARDMDAYRTMLESCSTMTVVNNGMELEASIDPADSPTLSENGEGFVMEVAAEAFTMVTRTGWGQVEDVHFSLIGMSTGDRSQEEVAAEFDEVLTAGLESLHDQI